jgi:hypothetical protein
VEELINIDDEVAILKKYNVIFWNILKSNIESYLYDFEDTETFRIQKNTANKSVSARVERNYERAPHTPSIMPICRNGKFKFLTKILKKYYRKI